ncbi:hypothetical protein BN946_scf185042.g146 [Trametes cinnabarina]|uniref:Uncharacterized protein n=1 Tax=Pycnoporus cinnabarinus TaxID=5643 RepID=A0A060SAC8_PYCCI|nr:hypothetical protein BN946_scf185042.g146 [Trametes cinnabarina]
MSSLTLQERVAFVQDIELQHPVSVASAHTHGTVAADGSAAVVAGSIVSFVGNIENQMKASFRLSLSDVLNSTLFAQLSANKMADPHNDRISWFGHFKSVLENLGWVVPAWNDEDFHDANSIGSVDQLILRLAQDYLSAGEFALFQTVIDSLKEAKNDSALKLFDSSSKESNKANFRAGVVSDAQSNAMFKIWEYSYHVSQDIDNVLFFDFGSQRASFKAGNCTLILDEDVYTQVRGLVLEKLGENARNLIKTIEI